MRISDEEFVKLWNEGTSTEIMIEIVGLSNRRAVVDKAYTLRKKGFPLINRNSEKIDTHLAEVNLEKANDIKVNWRELLQNCASSKELLEKTKLGQLERYVFLDTDKPIILLFTADFHCGAYATDYGEMLELLDYIFEHDIYLGIVGDLIETFVNPGLSAYQAFSQLIDPETQYKILHDILQEMYDKERLVFFVNGNHETKVEKIIGIDLIELIFHNKKIPYMPDGGVIRLKVGKIVYEILAKHKLLRESSINITNANRAAYDSIYPGDIIVSAHRHVPAKQTVWRHEKKVLYIKVGTMKTGMDRYGTRFWTKGEAIMPCVVLFPDRKKMVDFDDVRDAVKWLS